jgi:hypothetical protein
MQARQYLEYNGVLMAKKLKIYVTHAASFDYKNQLYFVLQKSELNKKCKLIFPHSKGGKISSSKSVILKSDLIIAEVSYPSTGQGIELGWAHAAKIPIICIYKKGSRISSSLKIITKNLLDYESPEEMVNKLSKKIIK